MRKISQKYFLKKRLYKLKYKRRRMIVIFTGLPGSGKSFKLARTVVDVLYRNVKVYAKQLKKWEKAGKPEFWEVQDPLLGIVQIPAEPKRRHLYTNLKLAKPVEDEFEGFIHYWTELRDLTPLRDADVIIDEVSTYFDARLWETLSLEMRRWLAQHRKFGIEIYGTAQDFAQVDKAFRRLTSDLLYLKKLIGSRDISATLEPPRFIWGICLVNTLDPTIYDEQKSKFAMAGIPRLMYLSRKGTQLFDTRAEVSLSGALPLKHLEKACELPNCDFHKIVHV